MTDRVPSVGRIVHYVSYGTPGGEFTSECRAAIIVAVGAPSTIDTCGLAVFNPSGMFFNICGHDETEKAGGTWHWPERQ